MLSFYTNLCLVAEFAEVLACRHLLDGNQVGDAQRIAEVVPEFERERHAESRRLDAELAAGDAK